VRRKKNKKDKNLVSVNRFAICGKFTRALLAHQIFNSRLCRVENLRAPIPDYVFHAISCVKSLSDSRLCIPCYQHSEISHFSIPDYVEHSIPGYVFQTMYSHPLKVWTSKSLNRVCGNRLFFSLYSIISNASNQQSVG
jgi:hypothetical protein